MGIIIGIAAEIAIEAATAAAASAAAAAEAAGEAATAAAAAAAQAAADAAAAAGADAAADAAAAAAAEGPAAAAGETAAATVADIAAEDGAEAGEMAADKAVEEAAEKTAQKGATEIVKKVIKTMIRVSMVEELIRNTIKIVDTLQAKERIKKILDLLHTATKHTKTNIKTWNEQINKAIQKGKLRKWEKLPDGDKLYEGKVFSMEMNSKVDEFLSSFQPSIIRIAGVAKTKDLGKIQKAVQSAKHEFVKAADTFHSTVKKWDRKDTEIKSEAGVNFHRSQLEADISAVKSQEV